MTTQTPKTYFDATAHENADRLRLVVEELEGAADDLRTARARHQEAELSGCRSELVESMRTLAEAEAVHAALGKQHAAMASHLADSLQQGYRNAKVSAEADDHARKAAGMEAMAEHIESALESLQQARTAFLDAASGDETSALTLNRQIKDMVSLLPLDLARTVPTVPVLQDGRRLLPAGLARASEALSALLK